MQRLHEFRRRLRFLFHGARFDRELDEEMRAHLELQAEANREAGMDAEEARYAAVRRFGNPTLLKEKSGDAWGWRPLERLWQDLRYALRVLRRTPLFTATVVLTLALGIGANTAIFSVMNALLFNPYPFPESNGIMAVEGYHARSATGGTGYRDFLDWRAQNTVFEEMAIVPWTFGYVLTGQGEPQRLIGGVTTSGFLRVLGVQPFLGRFFTPEEDSPGGPRVVVLSYTTWQQRFAGRADVLGQTITLNAKPYTIIGVMPGRFAFPGIWSCEMWMPLQENPANARTQHQYGAMARLKPGITVERAQADMTAIARHLEQQYAETNKGWGVMVMPMAKAMSPAIRTGVITLFSAVIFVLLLACANVAALMLARASGRAREIAVRASLGASRLRIVRQMLTESVLLALVGGALGLLVTHWLIEVIRRSGPGEFGLGATLRLDAAMLGFTLALSLLTGVVFGLAPAWYGSRTDLSTALKGGSNAGSGARSRNRLLSAVVAGEVALSLVLLAGAGVLVGVPPALAAARLMRSLLYGVSPRDLGVFLGVPLVLLLVALAASYIPARRAARVDPLVALRYE
jgi:predicted permease